MSVRNILFALGATLVLAGAVHAAGNIQITEWMYSGTNGEFIEFTNVGDAPIDLTNWSYSDSARVPGSVNFGSVFGIVQVWESVIFTETDPNIFRTAWGLSPSVRIFGPNTVQNIGRSDEINLYDALDQLVDRLTYNDQAGLGPRTQYASCTIPFGDLGLTSASGAWVLATVGDAYGSWASTGGDIANPGIYVPEPGGLAALAGGFLTVAACIRRRK